MIKLRWKGRRGRRPYGEGGGGGTPDPHTHPHTHDPFSFVVADEAARDALTLVAEDLYGTCLVLAPYAEYVLTTVSPPDWTSRCCTVVVDPDPDPPSGGDYTDASGAVYTDASSQTYTT